MRRRDFLALAGVATATAWPLGGLAQQAAKVPRVVLASGGVEPTSLTTAGDPRWAAFLNELASKGFVEGRTVVFERYRATPANATQLGQLIVQSAPDLIFSGGATNSVLAAIPLTKTIPIVAVGGDLLSQGVVGNLARPGGNVTGLTLFASADFEAKNLALLAEMVPGARRIAYLNSGMDGRFTGASVPYAAVAASAAANLGLALVPVTVEAGGTDADLTQAFLAALAARVDAVQLGLTSSINVGSITLARLALEAKLPAISPFPLFARSGGLFELRPQCR